MNMEVTPSELFPTFPNSGESELSHFRLINGFVYLPAAVGKRINLEEFMNEFEVVEESKIEDYEWINISNELHASSDQTIQKMLERPYNKKEWWKAGIEGFPVEMRGTIWTYLITAKSKCLKERYIGLLNEKCEKSVEKDIKKDINRTFAFIPGFTKYQGTRLYNVLKAYSCFDPEVGYCQGMNYIVGIMLLYMEDEADAFCLLADILNKFHWRKLYVNGMPKLTECISNLEKRIKNELPKIYKHFIENELNMYGPFPHFFITTFLYSVPFNFGVRVFELFLIEGENAIMECIVNMLNIMKDRILEMQFDRLHEYIKSGMANEFYIKYNSIALLVSNT